MLNAAVQAALKRFMEVEEELEDVERGGEETNATGKRLRDMSRGDGAEANINPKKTTGEGGSKIPNVTVVDRAALSKRLASKK